MFILFFSISFVCLVVTLLILCIIPLWDSVPGHAPSCKELNPSCQEECPFFRSLHLGIQFSLHPASSLFGTQQQLTHPPVKEFMFLRACCLLMFSHYLAWALFVLLLTHLLIKSICQFILSVVYFYSERPLLCREV